MKKITIGTKPTSHHGHGSADAWVNDRAADTEPTKRLTIDIPLSLHQRVKSQCALRGENMADVVRAMLLKHFEESPGSGRRGDILTENN